MVRKKVPEWLNSTMWSTPPSQPSSFNDDSTLLRHSPATKMSSMKKEEAESISVTPPPSTASSVPSRRPRNNGSSISGEYGNSSVAPSSAEDFSRQAHLSAEVNCNLLSISKSLITDSDFGFDYSYRRRWLIWRNWGVLLHRVCLILLASVLLPGRSLRVSIIWFACKKTYLGKIWFIFVAAFAWLLATWTFTLVIWVETKEITVQAL